MEEIYNCVMNCFRLFNISYLRTAIEIICVRDMLASVQKYLEIK